MALAKVYAARIQTEPYAFTDTMKKIARERISATTKGKTKKSINKKEGK